MSHWSLSFDHPWVAIQDKEVTIEELTRITRWRKALLGNYYSFSGGI